MAEDGIQREVLPIPDRRFPGLITYDARDPDSSFAPIAPVRPPAGAPNVLLVLLDDVGFGAGSAFGGPCEMPVAERVAAQGLKYTRFHTTALCSPTRAALISGRNHHAVGMGHITENASASPGRTSVRPAVRRGLVPPGVEGEAGSPVTVVSLPGRRAAGGRPQGRP